AERGEDIQLRRQRDALVGVCAVTAGPEKRLAGGAFQAADVDAASAKDGRVVLTEVVADHADQIDAREIARRHGKIGGRAAEGAFHFAEGRFERIERHRTYNKK